MSYEQLKVAFNDVETFVRVHENKYLSLKKNNPDWDNKDLRVTMIGLPGNRLLSCFLNLKMIGSTLLNTGWWESEVSGLKEFQHRVGKGGRL